MSAERYRNLAAKHATLQRLYNRMASKQELFDTMTEYGTRLAEVELELVELNREVRELERQAREDDTPPRPTPTPTPGRT